MVDGIEYLLVDMEVETVEELLTVDGRIVAIETCAVVLLCLSVPSVGPDVRELVRTDINHCIHEVVNSQLENRRAVATVRCACTVVNRSRLTESIAVEDVVLTLEDVLLDDVVVRLVDGEYQGDDAVATVSRLERVTIDTSLGVGVVLERVCTSLTHAVTYGVEDLFKYINLQSVEILLSVNGRIVAVKTGVVVFLSITVPAVSPNERQVVSTNICDRIYQRMNGQLEYRRTVAAFRSTCVVGDRLGLTDRISVEDVVSALEHIFLNQIVVRLVNCQDKGRDAVATVDSVCRIAVDARLRQIITLKLVERTFADSSVDGVEDLLKHVDLQSVVVFLSVNSCIVAVETGVVVFLSITVPAVSPNERQVVSTNICDRIYQRMNGQLEYRRTVAAFRSTCAVSNRLGLTDRISVEDVIATFEHIFLNQVVVRFVNCQDKGRDAVATVSGIRRVTVDAWLRQVSTLELIVRTLADSSVDGVEDLLKYVDLQSVVVFLCVNGCIVAVETGVVVLLCLSVPAVSPNERQVVSTYICDRIYQRMNGQLEYRRTVTTGRSQCSVGSRRGLTDRVAEEYVITAFEYILADDIVVRLVDGEDKGLNAVATVRSAERVTVDTRLFVLNAVEVIVIAFANRSTDGIEDRFVHYKQQCVERTYAVHIGRVVAVLACLIEQFGIAAPLVDPGVRQLVLTYGNDRIDILMNGEEQFDDRVATGIGRTVVTVGARSRVGVSVERVVLAFVNINRHTYINRLVHLQYQGHDAVATVGCGERIGVNAVFVVTYAVEQVIRSFAHLMTHGIFMNRDHAYVAYVSAVIIIVCL